MTRRPQRVGIERKILTQILWVGILPMAVAVIVGYLTARRQASDSVRDTLEISASKVADGMRRDIGSRLSAADHLAAAPSVVDLLEGADSNTPFGAQARSDMTLLVSWLARDKESDQDAPSTLTLYDREGKLAFTTHEGNSISSRMPSNYPRDPEGAQFCSFNPMGNTFTGTIIAPVWQPAGDELLGYLTITSGMNSLLEYSLGGNTSSPSASKDSYQLLVVLSGSATDLLSVQLEGELAGQARIGPAVAVRMNFDEQNRPVLETSVMNKTLARRLSERPRQPGTYFIPNYQAGNNDVPRDVLLAYRPLRNFGLNDADIYFAAYRGTQQIFAPINRAALLALAGCILFIAVLCLRAYRDVHNNIVRPVSLLNEGAQIIRQGDFDLKLKITTGDEIEELASSFNQMAQALRANVLQLETSEEKYRTLVTSMRDGIYQTDKEGLITFLNPAGVDILGFGSIEQAFSSNMRNMFIEPIDFDPATAVTELDDGEERSRIWMKRWDDRTICVELSRNRLYDEDAKAIGMEGTIRDVTKNVHLEEEARKRSERINAINQIANVINSSLEAGRLYESLVVELKKVVDFDYASVALLSETGVGFDGRDLWPEDALGGRTFTLDARQSYAAWVARERRCLSVDDLRDGASPFAEQFPAYVQSCLCVPLYAMGRIIGTLNLGAKTTGAFSRSSIDTLEQMAPHLAVAIRNAQLLMNLQLSLEEVTCAREKLYEANEELKTLDELKTNLLSNVSHELRTPLVSVMGYTDMILNEKAGPINKTQKDYMEISLRNIEKLVTLIENLLDFSRLHRGDERLVFNSFDLVACARMSMEIVQPLADGRNIAVTIFGPDGPIPVDGDKGKMGQVFNNLLSNAVKFNENGGSVDVEFKVTQHEVEVIVRDTGIGIPKEALEKVFTRFYQYDGSSTRKYGGTGIGLAIAQDIVRMHGSSISVTSEQGEGSVFRFTLSLAAQSEPIAESPGVDLSDQAHVLVELVSDDRSLSDQIRDFLSAENMDMIHALDAERAIELAERHSPDCVLVDLGPDSNDALLSLLLNEPALAGVPIILLTNDDSVFENYRARVAARVKRSFRKSSLLSGIHNALNRGTDLEGLVGDKILCVDDDPEILMFMQRCLESEGYITDQSESGEEALKRVGSREYGLVLLDVSMPGIDGWETCARIKGDPRIEGIKVYMVTAKPMERNMNRMRECGADGFLMKPFHSEDLVQLVDGLEMQTVAK